MRAPSRNDTPKHAHIIQTFWLVKDRRKGGTLIQDGHRKRPMLDIIIRDKTRIQGDPRIIEEPGSTRQTSINHQPFVNPVGVGSGTLIPDQRVSRRAVSFSPHVGGSLRPSHTINLRRTIILGNHSFLTRSRSRRMLTTPTGCRSLPKSAPSTASLPSMSCLRTRP